MPKLSLIDAKTGKEILEIKREEFEDI